MFFFWETKPKLGRNFDGIFQFRLSLCLLLPQTIPSLSSFFLWVHITLVDFFSHIALSKDLVGCPTNCQICVFQPTKLCFVSIKSVKTVQPNKKMKFHFCFSTLDIICCFSTCGIPSRETKKKCFCLQWNSSLSRSIMYEKSTAKWLNGKFPPEL